MHINQKLLRWLVPAVCLARVTAQDQAFYDKVQITDLPVAGGIHLLQGSGGNMAASAGPDGVLLVDDQFAPLAEKIRAKLKELNPGPLRFIINTHWHGDHTGGNEKLGTEGAIIAQDNVRKRLSSQQTIAAFKQTVPASPAAALPVITFAESLSVHFNGEEIRVLHFPRGHTDGDSFVWFTKSGVIHLGDEFFMGDKSPRFPFVDASSGGDVQQLAKNIAIVIKLLPPDIKIIPGHGPLATLDDLKAYQTMLTECIELVRSRIASGKTLSEIQAEGLPEKWRDAGSGFIKAENWIEEIYYSLTRGNPQ
jgi:cyclase